MQLKILRIKAANGERLASTEDVVSIMEEEAYADRECLWVLHINIKNRIIEKELVSMGILDSSYASPREVFKKAILNSASAIIVVHNHPSGDSSPSVDDMKVLKRLEHAGDILDIPVIDFIIISPDGHWSSRRTTSKSSKTKKA